MTALKDRESAFENKYANDQETLFRLEARACKQLGLWAAQEMGLTGQEAEDYAYGIVSHNLKEPGLNDVVEKITSDLSAANKDTSAVGDLLMRFLAEAENSLNAD